MLVLTVLCFNRSNTQMNQEELYIGFVNFGDQHLGKKKVFKSRWSV